MGDAPSGMGGQSSWTMRKRAGMGSRVWYGGCPSRSSITTHPTLLEHKSTTRKKNKREKENLPYIWRSCSPGLFNNFWGHYEKTFEYCSANNYSQKKNSLQYGLPTTAPSVTPPVFAATPKSANLTVPSLFVRILAPLISRWMTPWSWR